ncbi:hypothetical protein [Burkholderia ubonensis]|uniref:hypothetical protein n=1 Tax=Burkholderia ubonensis TaxID=101571 RepID=UPI0012F72C5D|nr:hypothetical protein [Burkholderia ubonensis]
MSVYAYIVNGAVYEVIQPAWEDGVEIPIDQRYTQQFVGACVDITDVAPQPKQGWRYDGKSFIAPATP